MNGAARLRAGSLSKVTGPMGLGRRISARPRAISAGATLFVAAAVAGCGSSGTLLSTGQAGQLTAQLSTISRELSARNCQQAASDIANFQSVVAGLGSDSVNQTLVSNLNQGASTVAQLAARDCPTSAGTTTTATTTTKTTKTKTQTTTTPTTTTSTTDTTTTASTPTETSTTGGVTIPTPTTTSTTGTTTTPSGGGSGGTGTGTTGGAGLGGGTSGAGVGG